MANENIESGSESNNASRQAPARVELQNSSPRPLPAALDPYEYAGAGKEEKVDLRKIWYTVRKRKWLIVAIMLLGTIPTAFVMYRAKPVYQAGVMIEIRKDPRAMRENNPLDESEDLSDPLYMVNIKTKMLGLQSVNLHEDVISDLDLDKYPEFISGASESPVLGRVRSWMRSAFGRGQSISPRDDLPPSVLRKANAAPDGGDELPLDQRTRLAPYVKVLQSNLYVEPIRDTQAISVTFTHTDPVLAAAVVNSIAEKFVQRNFRTKTRKVSSTASWLERSTAELKQKMEEAEQELADYCRQNNIVSIDEPEKESLTSVRLKSLHEAATRAEMDRMLKETMYQAALADGVAQLPDAVSDQELNALQKQLYELQSAAAQLSVKFGPKNPRLLEVQQQIAVVEKQIEGTHKNLEAKLKADYDRALQNERSLKTSLAAVRAEAVEENQANIRYHVLKQNVDTARGLYTDFLQKTSQARLRVAEQDRNMRIIEPAQVPLQPVGPSRLLVIALAFLTSLGAGIGLVFFLDYLDNTIHSIEDVNRYVQLPALGVIPAASGAARRRFLARKGLQGAAAGSVLGRGIHRLRESKNTRAIVLGDRSPVAEAYRVLRTSVLLLSGGNPPRTILITSSQPGEGKTTTVVNTAISLAQVGASVLIIDADLRTPATHKMLGVDHEPGLSTYLSGGVEIEEVIQKLQIPNLSLLPAGPIPTNPAELIGSKKMRELLATLAERYDHILIDSPPLVNLADPLQLSTLVDGVILVVHGGKCTRDMVFRAREDLLAVGAEIYGVVLNNADLQRSGFSPQSYYSYAAPDPGPDRPAA